MDQLTHRLQWSEVLSERGLGDLLKKRVETRRLTSASPPDRSRDRRRLSSPQQIIYILDGERERKGSGHKCFEWYLIHMKLDSSQRISEQYFFNVKLPRGSLARAT